MLNTKEGFQLNQKIKDDKFNVDHIDQYNLALQVNDDLFRVCITDTKTNRCLLLEDYQFTSIKSVKDLIQQLDFIYDDHHTLQAGYWKSIKLSIKNKNFSLVPDSLFDKTYLKEYLNINCSVNGKEVYYHKQKTTDTVNIYAADKELIEWFKAKYPHKAIRIFHNTSSFIEGLMIDKAVQEERSVFIVSEKNLITVLVKKNKRLEFCNSFSYVTPEDFIYFVMFVYDQLKLNPETTPVTIWGEVTPDSAIYSKLYKYIRYIHFGNKPSSLSFGYQFDEVFDHKFYDLYTMHFCE
jgi:hypothetical protein